MIVLSYIAVQSVVVVLSASYYEKEYSGYLLTASQLWRTHAVSQLLLKTRVIRLEANHWQSPSIVRKLS